MLPRVSLCGAPGTARWPVAEVGSCVERWFSENVPIRSAAVNTIPYPAVAAPTNLQQEMCQK